MTCKLLYLQPSRRASEYLGIRECVSVRTCIWRSVHVWLSLHLSSLQPASENCQCGGEKIIIYHRRAKVSETSQTGNYMGMHVYTDALGLH